MTEKIIICNETVPELVLTPTFLKKYSEKFIDPPNKTKKEKELKQPLKPTLKTQKKTKSPLVSECVKYFNSKKSSPYKLNALIKIDALDSNIDSIKFEKYLFFPQPSSLSPKESNVKSKLF